MIEGISFMAQIFLKAGEKLSHAELRKKIIPGFLLFMFLIVLIANLSVTIGVFSWYLVKGIGLNYFWHNLIHTELYYANKSLVVWLLLFSILFFYVLWRKTSMREDKLREENLNFRYKTLKSQVNPHFLFNSLNTLSEIIYADVKMADQYIQKLSGIYRYILDNEDNDLIPLTNEVAFIEDYVELQKYRDDGKIVLTIQVPDPDNYLIVPVSLQVLVENAFKHNARSLEKPLKINISLQDTSIFVTNNIQRKNSFENSTRKGLANLDDRVKLILGKNLLISEENESFIVQIPIIPVSK
jgi:LytS/YehU family sensor histidine kinase